jgi:hypothetical protein
MQDPLFARTGFFESMLCQPLAWRIFKAEGLRIAAVSGYLKTDPGFLPTPEK